jgi:transcriptional regulator with XRE-family HTH domain
MITIDEGPYLERVGRFMKEIRESKGLTQTQMADILGVTPSSISKMEKGIVRINIFKVLAYCSLWKIKVSDFFRAVEIREDWENATRTGGNWPPPQNGEQS